MATVSPTILGLGLGFQRDIFVQKFFRNAEKHVKQNMLKIFWLVLLD